jgi:hypothetical protein
MGLMFAKIIPMETLVQLPLPFVHRLRDIRIKQLEEAQKQQQENMKSMQSHMPTGSRKTRPNVGALDPAMFNGTPYDDLIDELT